MVSAEVIRAKEPFVFKKTPTMELSRYGKFAANKVGSKCLETVNGQSPEIKHNEELVFTLSPHTNSEDEETRKVYIIRLKRFHDDDLTELEIYKRETDKTGEEFNDWAMGVGRRPLQTEQWLGQAQGRLYAYGVLKSEKSLPPAILLKQTEDPKSWEITDNTLQDNIGRINAILSQAAWLSQKKGNIKFIGTYEEKESAKAETNPYII